MDAIALDICTHNAGVEGSSPSLSTSILRHFRHTSCTHDSDCGRFAGGEVTDPLGGRDQVADIGRRVMRRDVRRLVPKQQLAVLELSLRG